MLVGAMFNVGWRSVSRWLAQCLMLIGAMFNADWRSV
jgi:hypothetical protein